MGVYRIAICPQCSQPTKPKKYAFDKDDKRTTCPVCSHALDIDKNWWIDYYVNSGRRKREKIGTSRALAEQVLAKRRVEIAENKYLDIKELPKTTLAELIEIYLRLHSKAAKRSWKSDERRSRILLKFFGNRPLREITPFLVTEFKEKRTKEIVTVREIDGKQIPRFVSVATVNRELALLKHMFTKAIEWGKAQDNPVKRVKLFKENNAIVRYLERDQLNKLIENASDHLRPILIVALNTGMRKGEILSLKWRDLDFKNNLIFIRQSKSGEAATVPMTEPVKKVLGDMLLRGRMERKHPESPYVFCNDAGKPYGEIRKSFFTACKKSGIKDFRFHDCRHHYASHLVMRGESLYTVQNLLRHKKPDMTMRYAHLSQDHLHHAASKLDDLMDTQVDTRASGKKEEVLTFSQVVTNK
ncbi:MAG: site-specific integrase [Candidatus Omnitrophota bacterium]